MTETHCHLNSPLGDLERHVNGSALCVCVCVIQRGAKESTSEWELSVFEVGIWSSHLHLMPFRLLVLTRAKHLTRLGLIWWGHGMTPSPPAPPPLLSPCSLSETSWVTGKQRGGGERAASRFGLRNHWAPLCHRSRVTCSLLSGHFASAKSSSNRHSFSPKKSIQSKHFQQIWKE